MDRRTALAALALALSGTVHAQGVRRPLLGYLVLQPIVEPPSPERKAFLDGLLALGWEAGRTVNIAYASAEGQADFLDEVARDLVRRKPTVIVAAGALAVLAATRATTTVPIVIMAVGDPVGIGAAQSLSRPGRNVTGVSFISSELAAKRVQLIAELLPAVRRVGVLWDTRNANAREEVKAATAAIRRLGLADVPLPVAADADVAPALARIRPARADVLYVAFEGGIVAATRTVIAEFGVRERVPIVSGWSSLTEAGALLSYAPDIPAIFRRSAGYVDRILKGTPPHALPVEQPNVVEMVINARTAGVLGIVVPQALLLRADRVIG